MFHFVILFRLFEKNPIIGHLKKSGRRIGKPILALILAFLRQQIIFSASICIFRKNTLYGTQTNLLLLSFSEFRVVRHPPPSPPTRPPSLNSTTAMEVLDKSITTADIHKCTFISLYATVCSCHWLIPLALQLLIFLYTEKKSKFKLAERDLRDGV